MALGILILLFGGIAAIFGCNFIAFIKRAAWLLILPLALFSYGCLIERNIFKINTIDIESMNIPKAFESYSIVHISDIHLRSFAKRGKALQRAVGKINALKPDLIVFSGDLVTLSADEIAPLAGILSQLKAGDGVYSVMGNHDYLSYAPDLSESQKTEGILRLKEAEAAMGWTMLDNRCVNLYRGSGDCISLIGIENLSEVGDFHSAGDIGKASEGVEGQFKILISHDPSAWDVHVSGKTDIDLTLSGRKHPIKDVYLGC